MTLLCTKKLFDYTVDDIDLGLIENKLWNIRRFNGHPGALMVRPHTALVQQLALADGASSEVVSWSYHHDDHEGIIGDVIGPVEHEVRPKTSVLDDLKDFFDGLICEARQMSTPTPGVKEKTHYYDKLAESLEWQFGLKQPDAGFHPPWPSWLDRAQARSMFEWAVSLKVGNL